MVVPPRLVTERLILRGFEPRDLAPGIASAADPEVQRYLGGPRGPYEAYNNMATHAGHWALRGYGSWAVERRADGELLGRLGLWYPAQWPDVEIGFRLIRAAWGQGIASEAAARAIRHGFESAGLPQIIAVTDPDNKDSETMLKRLGFAREGWRHAWGYDNHFFRLTKKRWETAR